MALNPGHCSPPTAGSIKVATRLGLTFDRTETIQGGEYSIYAIGRTEWERRAAAE